MSESRRSLKVSSQIVQEGKPIPTERRRTPAPGGQNVSPDLSWDAPPTGTQSLAITCHDPDAPTTVGFTHWVLFNLSPELSSPPSGRRCSGQGAEGRGPRVHRLRRERVRRHGTPAGRSAAPVPVHRLGAGRPAARRRGSTTTYAKFRFMIRGHVLAQGTLTGTVREGSGRPAPGLLPALEQPGVAWVTAHCTQVGVTVGEATVAEAETPPPCRANRSPRPPCPDGPARTPAGRRRPRRRAARPAPRRCARRRRWRRARAARLRARSA